MKKTTTRRLLVAWVIGGLTVALVLGFSLNALGASASHGTVEIQELDAAAAPAGMTVPETPTLRASVIHKQPTVVAVASAPAGTTRRPTKATRTAAYTASRATASTDELAEARRILASLIARYPILAGTTVTFGDARGHQAICYYRSGRIVISPNHTASLSRILNHEIWHIIDWRDNGRIDWGENVPPR